MAIERKIDLNYPLASRRKKRGFSEPRFWVFHMILGLAKPWKVYVEIRQIRMNLL
jgi:hypothetical protein